MANQYLSGKNGNVWLNGMLMSTIKDIEIKVTLNFGEINNCGAYSPDYVYNGWTGEGKMTITKVNSTVIKLLNDATENGIMPDIKIITSLTDKATNKNERVAITDVIISEYYLAKFEGGNTDGITEEIPFKFSGKQVLETL